jgi:hypothetical protein
MGRFTGMEFDFGTLGIINQTAAFTYTPDSRIATDFAQQNFNDDTPVFDSGTRNTYSYDENGDIDQLLVESFSNEVLDDVATETRTYNAFGDRLTMRSELDENLDDDADSATDYTYTYDEDGNLLTEVAESDFDANGAIELVMTTTYTYNTDAKPLTKIVASDFDNDGNADLVDSIAYTYDDHGNLLTEEKDEGDDDSVDFSETFTYTHDGFGNVLTQLKVRRGNGVDVSFRERLTHTYNGNGTLLMSTLTERDNDVEDELDFDFIQESTYTYTTHGGGWATQFHEFDFDGDGLNDSVSAVEHGYTPLEDGMFYLLLQYSDSSFFR